MLIDLPQDAKVVDSLNANVGALVSRHPLAPREDLRALKYF
jgi:hypothetical protein